MHLAIAIAMFMLSGAFFLGGILAISAHIDPGVAAFFGAFVMPCLLWWWGVVALNWRAPGRSMPLRDRGALARQLIAMVAFAVAGVALVLAGRFASTTGDADLAFGTLFAAGLLVYAGITALDW